MDVFSFTTGDFVSGLRPSIQPLGGLQDAHEAGFFGVAKRYYNYVFTELSGKLLREHLEFKIILANDCYFVIKI